jgi:hypothetical protein
MAFFSAPRQQILDHIYTLHCPTVKVTRAELFSREVFAYSCPQMKYSLQIN